MTDVVVLRYSEIFLKGGNRPLFERQLVDQARRVVADLPSARVEKLHGRVLVAVSAEEAARALERLRRVFGVVSLSPARVVDKDLEAIAAEAIRAAGEAAARRGGAPSFKVETRRSDKTFALTSPEVSQEIGGRVHLATHLPVDIHAPAIRVGVEIGRERSFVYAEELPGPGGLPVGSSGKANLLLSGGIDSPVAGWLAMKRGLSLAATYFHSFPYTGDRAKDKVVELCRKLTPWHGPMDLFVVGFTEVQKALRAAGPGELAVVLYRRMMVRAATAIAHHVKAAGLITGENLGQVASQTLANLGVIEEAAGLPILRPLITYDKQETVTLAQRIGTYETSILPYEDCCSLFVPPHPATRARLEDVERVEAGLDVGALAEQLANSAERVRVP